MTAHDDNLRQIFFFFFLILQVSFVTQNPDLEEVWDFSVT